MDRKTMGAGIAGAAAGTVNGMLGAGGGITAELGASPTTAQRRFLQN